jgi:hypothetical protein
MKTSELIEFLKTQSFTKDRAYNLIIGDLFEFVPEPQVAAAQELVAYFMYKIQEVCLPAIEQLKSAAS